MGARPDGPGVKLSTTERAAACMNLRLCGAPSLTAKEKNETNLNLLKTIFVIIRVFFLVFAELKTKR